MLVLVQSVERVHLIFCQLKVEHLGVCNDPLFRVRLGQWDESVAEFSLEDVRQSGEDLPSLQGPSDEDLGPALACLLSNLGESWVRCLLSLDHGGVGFQGDIVRLAV